MKKVKASPATPIWPMPGAPRPAELPRAECVPESQRVCRAVCEEHLLTQWATVEPHLRPADVHAEDDIAAGRRRA